MLARAVPPWDAREMRYARPYPGRRLLGRPVLESWDKAGSSSQTRLTRFLDTIADDGSGLAEPLAMDLVIALPEGISRTGGGHDLDNYLLPIVRRLGHQRFVAVFARKVDATAGDSGSTLAVETARPAGHDAQAPQLTCRTRAAGQSIAWKRDVATACSACSPASLPDGPIALQIHYRLSGRRNWAQQWKPTIDALGAVLGIPDPAHPYNPRDDRIVDLALSRTIDEALGWDIELEISWQNL